MDRLKVEVISKKSPINYPSLEGMGQGEGERDKNVPPIPDAYQDRLGFLTPPEGLLREIF